MENLDANCRLKHGLNVHCLAHIFQYLDSADLYTIGRINKFYNQIINDLVIPKHEVNFCNLDKRGIEASQMLEKYGIRVRKIIFKHFYGDYTIAKLAESITKYCAADQLKSFRSFNFNINGYVNVSLPNQFRQVEKLEIYGIRQLSAQLSDSLRFLKLEHIELSPNFDWTELKNLTEVRLIWVDGINAENFIKLLSHRPNIEVFHHDRYTFKDSTQDVCLAMAKYCGNSIREYYGEMDPNQGEGRAPGQNMYYFISGFKNIKKARLTTHQICGGDLIDAMKWLAENNTIEMLEIKYSGHDGHEKTNCIFHTKPKLEGHHIRHFSHLKSIKIIWPPSHSNYIHPVRGCDPFKLFTVYGSRILSSVENLFMACTEDIWYCIEVPPKLCHLRLHTILLTSKQASLILAALKSVLQKRNNGRIENDFIEVKLSSEYNYKLFIAMNGHNDSIKLVYA